MADARFQLAARRLCPDEILLPAFARDCGHPQSEKLFFLVIIVPAILLLFLAFGLVSRWSYAATRHPLPGALANADDLRLGDRRDFSDDRTMSIARTAFCWSALPMWKPGRTETLPGQESVWDYPRPPRLEKVCARLRVIFNDQTIADTASGYRVLETSHPPVYYIPPEDIAQPYLQAAAGSSWCEFKGRAKYWSLDVDGKRADNAGVELPFALARIRRHRGISGVLCFARR